MVKPPRIYIEGMQGLGDNIYQRAFLANAPEPVYLETPWPEVYAGLPDVIPCQPQRRILRTQSKNMQRGKTPLPWVNHEGLDRRRIFYSIGEGIFNGMRGSFGWKPAEMSLPEYPYPSRITERYALVRPATIREEWRADSRNPRPEYIYQAAEELRRAGIYVVSVADVAPGLEWFEGEPPPADFTFHKGELDADQLMALAQYAIAIVGPVGWILPAAIAYHTPAWIICGGWGAVNAPELLCDHSMRLDRVVFCKPDYYCECNDRFHACDKTVTGHRRRFSLWLAGLLAMGGRQGVGLPHAPAHAVR